MEKYKCLLSDVIKFLFRPFREHFLFCVFFFILATSPYVLVQIFIHGYYLNAFLLSVHCFVLSYIVTLLISLINNSRIRLLIQSIVIIISALDFALNFYCIFQLGYYFDSSMVLLMLNTNQDEAMDFMSVLLPKWIIAFLVCFYSLLVLFAFLSHNHNFKIGNKLALPSLLLLLLSLLCNIYSWNVWKDGPIMARIVEFCNNNYSCSLNSTHRPIIAFKERVKCPDNIILVIGESFARNHSSIYNYNKLTNPCLSALKAGGLLFAFDDVDAPAPRTIEAIRYMMSTYSKSDEKRKMLGQKNFYSIINLMQECGYKCYWFSNQGSLSKWNREIFSLASTCNEKWFLQREGEEKNEKIHKNYDMILVDTSKIAFDRLKSNHNFVIYHLIGSHFDYSKRYPQSFAFFQEKDYMDNPEHQRSILSTYDNSILYNDKVIEQIINLFSDYETFLVYISDHGQDMFRSSPDYFAHGKSNIPQSYSFGVEIPMFIYASPLFQKRYPDLMQRIKNGQDHPKHWNSDDLPYLIMDVIGAKEIDGEEIHSKSVLD